MELVLWFHYMKENWEIIFIFGFILFFELCMKKWIYRYRKLTKLPNLVGIVLESILLFRPLLRLFWEKKRKGKKNEWFEFYIYCKLIKLPSSIGIVPVSTFSERSLLIFIDLDTKKEKKKIIKSYRFCKLIKFLISVGIVPESWFFERVLFIWIVVWMVWSEKKKKRKKKRKKLKFTSLVNKIYFRIELKLFQWVPWIQDFYLFIFFKKTGKKKRKKKSYKDIILWFGDELSQVTPIWPHKSSSTVQIKSTALLVNELYQFTKIVCSFESNAPIQIKSNFKF